MKVIVLSAGSRHTFALKEDGTVVARGTYEDDQCDVPTESSVSASDTNDF